MNDAKKELISREAILDLLSNEETAKVSTGETAPMAEGDEYVDLMHLDKGVQRATAGAKPGMGPNMGHVLLRRDVHDATWSKILSKLAG